MGPISHRYATTFTLAILCLSVESLANDALQNRFAVMPPPSSWDTTDNTFASGVSVDGSNMFGGVLDYGLSCPSQGAMRWFQGQSAWIEPAVQCTFYGANDSNADGSVYCGYVGFHNNSTTRALRWQNGVEQILPDLVEGVARSGATSISADGTVISGGSRIAHDGPSVPVVWQGSLVIELPLLVGDDLGSALDVSHDGSTIVGFSAVFISGTGGYSSPCGVRWRDGIPTVLPDLPGGGDWAVAVDCSFDGEIAVGVARSESGDEAAMWVEATIQSLGDLPGGAINSYARGVSADGSIVVGWGTTDNGRTAFIWDREHGMRDLNEVLRVDYGLDLGDYYLTSAEGISADGTVVVGTAEHPSPLIGRRAWRADLVKQVCRPDITSDGVVNVDDLNILLSNWGTSGPLADINLDGLVDVTDLNYILSLWDASCE